MAYNPQIHNRRSIRLKGYDYSQAGAYFITICTHNREHLFGEIANGEMKLNELGYLAFNAWQKTPELRPTFSLDVFVIMPNHLHGIVFINDIDTRRGVSHMPISKTPISQTTVSQTVNIQSDKQNFTSVKKGESNSPLRSPANTVGAMVRGFKSVVTKQINLLRPCMVVWQRNYHEHIIRDDRAYQHISEYIINNPLQWEADVFYSRDV